MARAFLRRRRPEPIVRIRCLPFRRNYDGLALSCICKKSAAVMTSTKYAGILIPGRRTRFWRRKCRNGDVSALFFKSATLKIRCSGAPYSTKTYLYKYIFIPGFHFDTRS